MMTAAERIRKDSKNSLEENCLKLELTTVVDRTSACPDGRGAANLVAASRMRLRHRIETDLVEAAVALRTACGRFTDQSQTRAAHAWTLACAAMRCLVSNLSLQWLQSVGKKKK